MEPVITLTTDFGESAPYAAAMKGVILQINPAARIVDLSHSIPPQDVVHAAFFVAACVPEFPRSVIHVVVVDPGVGTDRRLLYAELAGHRLVVPDNGVLSWLIARLEQDGSTASRRFIHLTQRRFWREQVSRTFHGRDVFAPVAAHLSLGVDPSQLGPEIDDPAELPLASAVVLPDRIVGEVVFVDQFGNLITNIRSSSLPESGPTQAMIGGQGMIPWVETYGEAEPGELVALVGSSGLVEIAQVNGNAANALKLSRGAAVELRLHDALV